jgi:uncharacterized protein DUF6458
MGIGTSIFLFAVGAILRFAVTVTTQGFNLHAIGVILMVVGAIGVLLSLLFWSSWGGTTAYRRQTVVDGGTRRRVVEEDVV